MNAARRLLADFRVRADGRAIFAFSLLFFSGMWISKALHPLWFSANDALFEFGIGYSTMAAAGTSAFFAGRVLRKVPLRDALVAGCIAYSLGMGLRVFTSLPAAIASGALAGLGASLTLLCLSTWPFHREGHDDRSRIHAYSLWSSNLAQGTAVMLAGLFLYRYDTPSAIVSTLLFAATLPLLAALLLYDRMPRTTLSRERPREPSAQPGRHRRSRPVVAFALYSVFAGFLSSFVLPYIPVLLIDSGLREGSAVVLMGTASMVVFATQPLVLRYLGDLGVGRAYFVSVLLLSTTTGLFYFHQYTGWFIVCVILRYIAANLVRITQRDIEMRSIDRERAATGMGVIQGSFLSGDIAGGAVAGLVWSGGVSDVIFPVIGLATIASGVAFLGIHRRHANDA